MKAAEFPPAGRVTAPPSAATPGHFAGAVRKVVDRITYPATHPFTAITLYYALLVLVGTLVVLFVPGGRTMISGERLGELMGAARGNLLDGGVARPATWLSWQLTLEMALAMVGALALMLPTSWVYMAERQRKGFDQGVVQTMVVLSVAIAGVVVIVRNSTALAFSLAGIVAAVRYRNTLSDTRDTLYIFTCIGVGLASGVQALAAAMVLSAIFNYTILAFRRGDYGMCELGSNPRHLLVGAAAGAQPGGGNGKADKNKARKKDYNAVLLIRARDAERAKAAVDGLLATEVPRFHLAEIEANSKGKGVLKYLIRLPKKTDRSQLEDALLLRGAPDVVGARIH